MTELLQNLVHPTDGRLVATGLKPGAEAAMVKAFQEARLGVELSLVDQRADYSEYGAGNQDDQAEAEEIFECARCGDGDALRLGEECAYCDTRRDA